MNVKVKKTKKKKNKDCKNNSSRSSSSSCEKKKHKKKGKKKEKRSDDSSKSCEDWGKDESSSDRNGYCECEPLNEKVCKFIKEQYCNLLCVPSDNICELSDVHDCGVCTTSIDFECPEVHINGFRSNSQLPRMAVQSSECATNCDGVKKYLNLFEVSIHDVPNYKGERNGPRFSGLKSRVQEYINLLGDCGLDVAGVNFGWTSATSLVTVHHQNLGMHPVRFARKTAKALKAVGMVHHKV